MRCARLPVLDERSIRPFEQGLGPVIPPVNILVQAFRSDSSGHKICRNWLDGVLNGDARYGMAQQVLGGVVRITTHPTSVPVVL